MLLLETIGAFSLKVSFYSERNDLYKYSHALDAWLGFFTVKIPGSLKLLFPLEEFDCNSGADGSDSEHDSDRQGRIFGRNA